MVSVQIYVEGGGDQDRTLTKCRKAFHDLLDPHCSRKPKIVASGSRHEAFKDFSKSVATDAACSVLLVDAEETVNDQDTAWDHLQRRETWQRPPGSSDEQFHLMVQVMESWFLADEACLAKFYGAGFSAGSLPGNPDIEKIPKQDVLSGLYKASRKSKKGSYHKTKHGFEILSGLDFLRVCEASARAKAFLIFVAGKLEE